MAAIQQSEGGNESRGETDKCTGGERLYVWLGVYGKLLSDVTRHGLCKFVVGDIIL